MVLISLSIIVTIFVKILSILGYPPLVTKLYGGIDPVIGTIFVSLLGLFLFVILLSRGWFFIYKKTNLKGWLYASGLASLLGLIAIAVDFMTRLYPKDINVLFPKSLFFYPAMGYVAEITLQTLPLTLALTVLTPFSKNVNNEKVVWIGILFASLFEPTFQALNSAQHSLPLWFSIFEIIRIFIIILSQLVFFKRYDFLTMYWFRIVYYFFWHILWGHYRLSIIF
jgi:hypothetical protein